MDSITPFRTFLALALLLAVASRSSAATYYASPTGTNNATCLTPDNPGTIAGAYAKTVSGTSWEDGDTLVLLSGYYNFSTNGTFTTLSPDRKYLTIRGETFNPADTLLFGNRDNPTTKRCAFWCRGGGILRVADMTFTNFNRSDTSSRGGGAVHCDTYNSPAVSVDISNCVFQANLSSYGGAIWACNAYDCVFENNEASYGGAASAGTLTGCILRGNHANYGGGVYNASVPMCSSMPTWQTPGAAADAVANIKLAPSQTTLQPMAAASTTRMSTL